MKVINYRIIQSSILLAFLFSILSQAEPPDTLWTRILAGPDDEFGSCVQQTDDGGFIIVGEVRDYVGSKRQYILLIKTDAQGHEKWRRSLGKGFRAEGYWVQQTSDGGYIVAGHMKSAMVSDDNACLIKTDEKGKELWIRTFGGDGGDFAYSVQQTSDGGYILAGKTQIDHNWSEVYLVKTDKNGEEEWSKKYGGEGHQRACCVQQTADGGYIILGWAGKILLIKTDDKGNVVFSKEFGDSGSQSPNDICQTSDGGYIIASHKWFYDGFPGIYIIKTDQNGEKEWSRTFGLNLGKTADSVQQTADGGYIFAGNDHVTFSNLTLDLYLLRMDANGDSLWSLTYDLGGGEGANCIRKTSDGGYIILGNKGSYGTRESDADILLIKLGKEGEIKPRD